MPGDEAVALALQHLQGCWVLRYIEGKAEKMNYEPILEGSPKLKATRLMICCLCFFRLHLYRFVAFVFVCFCDF